MRVIVLLLLVVTSTISAEVRAVRTARAPVIDGRLDDEAWTSAPLI